MSRILLVEDDTMIASGILYALETEGYESHQTRKKSRISLRGLLLLGFKKMENGR